MERSMKSEQQFERPRKGGRGQSCLENDGQRLIHHGE